MIALSDVVWGALAASAGVTALLGLVVWVVSRLPAVTAFHHRATEDTEDDGTLGDGGR